MNGAPALRLNPAKLLRSKWTACVPVNKEKHFMVVALIEPQPGAPIVCVTMEALHSGRQFALAWQALRESAVWRQGWV
ncbi:TIGR02450 family Trp-rich protein [Massilia sp. PWRC2]|uniref:TIGR02450 family Trp-rich protein n=1 Tax=Massilia sp. PWRC2 TaxID=2804626 RepID=UPI003CE7A871